MQTESGLGAGRSRYGPQVEWVGGGMVEVEGDELRVIRAGRTRMRLMASMASIC